MNHRLKKHDVPLSYHLGDCPPSREQSWLLQTALLSENKARHAWEQWRTHVKLDDVDPLSYRLLPLVYRKLLKLGVEEPLLTRLKGVYRHTWHKNQMLFHQVRQIVSQLQLAGISTMLLKGTAMTIRYYRDNGARFMLDVDIMVEDAYYDEAVVLLKQLNWQPQYYTEETANWYRNHQFTHAISFKKNSYNLDLHTQLMPFVPDRDNSYWDHSQSIDWHGETVYILNATDQLFHICIHGVHWSYAYLSWIPDALYILNDPDSEIMWSNILKRAEETRMVIPLRNALSYVTEKFQAPVPSTVLRQLEEMPVSWIEEQEYAALSKNPGSIINAVKRAFFLGCRYRSFQHADHKLVSLSLTGWAKYYLIQWRIKNWWELPEHIMIKFGERLNQLNKRK